jgi:hypothetical protein
VAESAWPGQGVGGRCDAIHSVACYDILRIDEGAVASRLSNRIKLNERRTKIKYLPVWSCRGCGLSLLAGADPLFFAQHSSTFVMYSPLHCSLLLTLAPLLFLHILFLGAFGNDWTQRVLQQVMFPTLPGTPLTGPTDTPHTGAGADISALGGQGEGQGEGESSAAAINVPSVITFVTGNAKKRKEVEEILLTYQTSFELIAEKVRGMR